MALVIISVRDLLTTTAFFSFGFQMMLTCILNFDKHLCAGLYILQAFAVMFYVYYVDISKQHF